MTSAQQGVAILGAEAPGDVIAGPGRQTALSTFQGIPGIPLRRAACRHHLRGDDIEWRKWSNTDFYVRQGVDIEQMNDAQRAAAFDLMGAALSARGLQLSRDIMRLNTTAGELTSNLAGFNEGLYWFTVMGTPSDTKPWGFQVDGHHLAINYFVLGDQVVMSPAFFGFEPTIAPSGTYAGCEHSPVGTEQWPGTHQRHARGAAPASDPRDPEGSSQQPGRGFQGQSRPGLRRAPRKRTT
jgi:Protein of unknown function (DUF3500)